MIPLVAASTTQGQATEIMVRESTRIKERLAKPQPTEEHIKDEPIEEYIYEPFYERTLVQKYFVGGWFEGVVTKKRKDEEGVLYLIEYEDDDKEEVDQDELAILIQNSKEDYKNTPKKRFKQTHRKKGKVQKKGDFRPHTSEDSSLWPLLDPIDGKSVTRDMILALAKENPPSKDQLPDGLRHRIPEMVEFFVLMRERQLIQQGKEPQTDVLKDFHWCNNYRELDRGTAYFRSEVLRHFGDAVVQGTPMSRLEYTQEILGMSFYYRQCNLIGSFTDPRNPAKGIPRLGDFNPAFVKYVKSFDGSGVPFFTPAHLNQGFNKYIGYCKSNDNLLRATAEEIVAVEGNMKEICTLLIKIPGIGAFTAWQIACDLEEACCFGPKLMKVGNELEEVEMPDEYCMLGPGAEKGLRKIFGEKIWNNVKKSHYLGLAFHLRDSMEYLLGLVGEKFPLWKNRKVSLKVIEHVLCEYQKFAEIVAGSSQGQRQWRSRASMDERPVCCKGNRMIRCDTCHLIVCGGCQMKEFQHVKPADGPGWNCCNRCHTLEQLVLVDDAET